MSCRCCSPTATGCRQCACADERLANPPGLRDLTFSSTGFGPAFDRMRRRLSSAALPALRALTARRMDAPVDPAVGLLDAWACAGHVLGFYNDRLVHEHYLRTCRERRSAVELARLVGYSPRPGVAADAYLAFTFEDLDPEAVIEVPAGTRAYSQPGPGETMQPFETDEHLSGRSRWSILRPRLTAPQEVERTTSSLTFDGLATGLRPGDTLLLELDKRFHRRTVAVVEPLPDTGRTRVALDKAPALPTPQSPGSVDAQVLGALLKPPTVASGARERLALDPGAIFADDSYAPYGLLAGAYPGLGELDTALGGTAQSAPTGRVVVHAMRVRAALHGHNASLIPELDPQTLVVTRHREWNFEGTAPVPDDGGETPVEPATAGETPVEPATAAQSASTLPVEPLGPKEIALDAVYGGILPASVVAITSDGDPGRTRVYTVKGVRTDTRPAFNLPTRVTILELDEPWPPQDKEEERARAPRRFVVHAGNEPLGLATEPVTADVCGTMIDLDGYYPGLHPGRRVIVTGVRTDVSAAANGGGAVDAVPGAELVLVAGVQHAVGTPAGSGLPATTDTVHTRLTLAEPGLAYCFRRETVTIYGNTAHASHGESRAEVLGSGDATRPLQTFRLKQGPLTYVPAPTTTGVRPAFEARVEDLRWQEALNAASVGPGARQYVLRTDDEGATSVVFGLGARLPTGAENVRAVYRSGLGAVGNVRTGQIGVLASRPAGVSAVTNPLPATGGADPDDLDAVRRRTPVGLAALDRLVSAADVEDFARGFAGIGKARVVPLGAATDYRLVLAAEDDAPLSRDSALVVNLRRAMIRYGDLTEAGDLLVTRGTPRATIDLSIRTALLIGVRATLRLQPDVLWEAVLPRARAALFTAFSFANRSIGQAPYPGEAMAVLQRVRGVAWVDLKSFGVIRTGGPDAPATPTEVAERARDLLAGDSPGLPPDPQVADDEIAYLAPTVPGTLLLDIDEAQP